MSNAEEKVSDAGAPSSAGGTHASDKFLRIISNQSTGVLPALARGVLAVAEPAYAGVMRARNFLYTHNLIKHSHRAGVPVISVGNITTGGTGKSPVVHWLAEQLRAAGHRPAVLLRGYGAKPGRRGDEEQMLDALLNSGSNRRVYIQADPDRVRGAATVLSAHPEADVFILDDGFQHRRIARDFDLVLIDATNPFGHGHVIPRGLLREPLPGLKRASAFLVTRSDQVDAIRLKSIEVTLRQYNEAAPIFHSCHAITGFRVHDSTGERRAETDALRGQHIVLCAAIGNPEGLIAQLESLGGVVVACRLFRDHHAYTREEFDELSTAARQANAVIVTTEKDWPKLAPLARESENVPPIFRTELRVRFEGDADASLIKRIKTFL